MPRVADIYGLPYPDVVDGTTIESSVHNGTMNDIELDLNAPRPIVAGGTGASSALDARTNLSAEVATQIVTNYDSHVWEAGSFRSSAGTTGEPVASHSFAGTCLYFNSNEIVLEARDLSDGLTPGTKYIKQKKGGIWDATWSSEEARYVNVAGDTMTGTLTVARIDGSAGLKMIEKDTHYTKIYDGEGTAVFSLGGAANPTSYYFNGNHSFYDKAGTTSFANLNVSAFSIPTTTPSTSPSNGALVVAGGIGAGGAIHTPTPAQATNDTTVATTAFIKTWAAPFDALAYNGIQINGSFDISQELGLGNATTVNGLYGCDGWKLQKAGTMGVYLGAYAYGAAPFGLPNSLAMGVTTAQLSLGGNDYLCVTQNIEGYRVARLAWGTAQAQPITLAFWSSHVPAGIYSIRVINGALNRSYVTTYTQAVAGAMQYNVITIPGDTTGTWTKDNTLGMQINFTYAAGATLTAPAANVWGTTGYMAAPGQVNAAAATSGLLRITGVVVLPGSEAPSADRSSFIMRPYDQELVTCQRYLNVLGTSITAPFAAGLAYSTTLAVMYHQFSVTMRAVPSFSTTLAANWHVMTSGGVVTVSGLVAGGLSVNSARLDATVASGLTTGQGTLLQAGNTSAQIMFNARI